MVKLTETKFKNVKNITSDEYFCKDQYASKMFDAKYPHKKGDKIETPAEVFMRIAEILSSFEKQNKENIKNKWFSLMWDGWFRPGGSIISGLGLNRKQSLANCTHVPLSGDSLEDISKCDYDLMKVAAYRQGVGFDASKLRPRGSKVGNSAEESTGVIPWVDKLVKIGEYVGQKGRKPALLVSLKVTHPDIEEFIVCKKDLNQIQNANISVQITDDFMNAVINDRQWELYFDLESGERISKFVYAKQLFSKIANSAYLSAEPGVQYIDLMRNGSMVQCVYLATGDEKYQITGSNACSEKPLPPYSVCNLLSVNMENFSVEKEEYEKELEEIVPYLVRLSDNAIQYELDNKLSPLQEQREMVKSLREIGIGITNVHGWLLKQNLPYDSDEAILCLENFMKNYSFNVFKSSVELGKEKGNCPAFDLVKDKSIFMNSIYFKNIVNEFYNGDPKNIQYMRNMAHMSIAPTGSLSSTFPSPCISSGIEPVIGLYYWRRTRAIDAGQYTYYFIIPQRLKEYLISNIPKETEDYKIINNFGGSEEDNDGNIGLKIISIIDKYFPKDFFKPAHKISPFKKIKMMGSLYKWIDAAISCTYNLPEDADEDIVEKIYLEAWKNGIRAVSVYREGSRQGILIFEDPETNRKKYEIGYKNSEIRPKSIEYSLSPKRPRTLPCNIHHCSIKGNPWLVIVSLLNGEPYELFAGEKDDIYISNKVKNGEISKGKNGKYSLEIKNNKSNIIFDDIAETLMTAEQKALTRLISLSMRHGTPLEFIQKQLKKANGDITDFSTVVARVLSGYIKQYLYLKDDIVCPKCKQESMIKTESCMKCSNPECGYSRCE